MKDFTSLPPKIFAIVRGQPEGSFLSTNCRPQKNGTWNADIDGGNLLLRRTLAAVASLGIGVWLALSQSGPLVL
jgi:hypothetical protein